MPSGGPRAGSSLATKLPAPSRLLALGVAAVAALALAYVTVFWVTHATWDTPGDAHNYVLAGLRLNAGHFLYSYSPGDEQALFAPEYPLFSPPLLGVLFRAIVLLPGHGEAAWWIAMDALELVAVAALLRRAPLVAGLAIIALSLSIGMAMEVGNVDCLVLAGLLLAWLLIRRGNDTAAGALIAVLASLKLTPAIFVLWLFATGRRRAAGVAVLGGIILGLVAIAGTEPLIFVKFYDVTAHNLSAPAGPLGPVAVATSLGVPASIAAYIPRAILVAGAVGVWLLRRHPGAAWGVAALLMWLGSPATVGHTAAIVLAGLAPVAWPLVERRAVESHSAPVAIQGERVGSLG